MTSPKRHKPTAKVWLEFKGQPLLGKGGADILEAVKTEKSISKAAIKVGMSYRYVWNYLARLERSLAQPVAERYRGGEKGGGGAKLTVLGEDLLKEYKRVEAYVGEVLEDQEYWVAAGLKISARNRMKGVVKSVEKGDIIAKVRVEVSAPSVVTSLISREAVEDLDIKVGDKVEAVIKATEVMIAKEK
jgi:molybdate transport system regulatory protein